MEKAVEELTDFRCMANSSFSTMSIQRGQLKRTKETSSSIGVSPDTTVVRSGHPPRNILLGDSWILIKMNTL